MAYDESFPGPSDPGARSHWLRRVQVGIIDGFDAADPQPDSLSTVVGPNLFPAGMPDEHALYCVMTPEQAENVAQSLLTEAKRCRERNGD